MGRRSARQAHHGRRRRRARKGDGQVGGGRAEYRQRRSSDGAITKVGATYQLPFLAHATMEPMNCAVHLRKDDCEIWVGSQAMAWVQAAAAKTAGLPLDKVIVHNH